MSISVLQVVGNRGMGGMERHVVQLSRGLRERGLRVAVACKQGSWLSDQLGGLVETYTLPMRRRFDFSSAGLLADLLREIRPDVVHAHGPVAYKCALAAVSVSAKLVVSVHGLSGWNQSLARADVVVAVSEWMRAAIRRFVEDGARTRVIYGGIDCAAFAAFRDAPPTFRQEFGLGERPVVTCVGRLVPAKGQHVLIEAARRVLDRRRDVRFVIVGSRSRRYEGRLRRLCACLGVQDAVMFAGEREDVPRVLASSDVVVQPSLEEAHGVAVIEAMAAGLPVVASRVGGIIETVEDGATGILVPPGDPEALAGALVRLIGDPEERGRMGRRGCDRANREFGIDVMIERFVSLYEELARARPR